MPTKNPEALAGALEKLIRDPDLRRRMGAAGREKTVAEFSQERVIEQTLAIYHALR